METTKEVIWKPCKGFEGYYEVSSRREIRSVRRGKVLRVYKNYESMRDRFVIFQVEGTRHYINVRKMYYMTFFGWVRPHRSKKKVYFKRVKPDVGIRWRTDCGKYEVFVHGREKWVYVGCFATVEEARLARDAAYLELEQIGQRGKKKKVEEVLEVKKKSRKYVKDVNTGKGVDVSIFEK